MSIQISPGISTTHQFEMRVLGAGQHGRSCRSRGVYGGGNIYDSYKTHELIIYTKMTLNTQVREKIKNARQSSITARASPCRYSHQRNVITAIMHRYLPHRPVSHGSVLVRQLRPHLCETRYLQLNRWLLDCHHPVSRISTFHPSVW
jgi:hypothetical protein